MFKFLRRFTFNNKSDISAIHNYWDGKTLDEGNTPDTYLQFQQFHVLSRFLLDLINKYGKQSMPILEIGCNAGRNLDYLYRAGFKNLSGIEINQPSLALMAKTYPDMYSKIKLYNNPVESVIRLLPDNNYDIVFTAAVLYHIHYQSEWIFKDMVRITGKYIITIENEYAFTDWRHFPRNYKHVFEKLGMKQVETINCASVKGLTGFENFKARVFVKKGV